MRTAVIFALVLSSSSVATAGTYVSIGLGGKPTGHGALAVPAEAGDSDVPQQRVALGQSLGRIALEASVGRFGIGAGSAVAAGVHARLAVPLDGNLNLIGRLGVERVWIKDLAPALDDSADGMVGAVGLEYRLSAPILGQAAIWAELSQDQLTLPTDAQGGVRMWTVGVSLGL